jgi:hypothetical protein
MVSSRARLLDHQLCTMGDGESERLPDLVIRQGGQANWKGNSYASSPWMGNSFLWAKNPHCPENMSEMIAGRRTITTRHKQTIEFQNSTSKYWLAKIALNCRFSSQNSTSYKFATYQREEIPNEEVNHMPTMYTSKRRNNFQQIKMAYYWIK